MAAVLPLKDEVDTIFSKLGNAVSAYSPDAGIKGAASRAEVRELAKRLFLSTMTPGELGVQHCKEVRLILIANSLPSLTDPRWAF